MDLQADYARCTALAESHYENFPVGRLVPAAIRPHVHAVYAFARVADDLADEGYVPSPGETRPVLTPEQRITALDHYEEQFDRALRGLSLDEETGWIFRPVADSVEKKHLPPVLFRDLLSAFRQDVVKKRYENHTELLDYCRRSANPIGRLVLHLHDYHGEEEHLLSDHICTALQLTNFWQDISVDLLKDRIYLPQEDMRAFGFDETRLFRGEFGPEVASCVEFQVNRAWHLFDLGRPLPARLHKLLRWEIGLTWLGGTTILLKIKKQGYNTLHRRPKLGKLELLRLLPAAWFVR
jgi:phytoene synthase